MLKPVSRDKPLCASHFNHLWVDKTKVNPRLASAVSHLAHCDGLTVGAE